MALTIGQLLIPLLSFPYLTRILKPDGIGLVSFVESIVMYMVLLASLGIPIYGVREIAKCVTKEERSKVFCEIFSIHAIAIIIGLIIYCIIVLSFTKTHEHLPFFALGIISYIAGNLTFEWFFQGSENYKFITIRSLLVKVVVLIAIFIIIKSQDDLLLYYGVLTSGLMINTVINVFYLRKQLVISRPSAAAIKKHIRPILNLFATRFVISIYVVLLNALIGFLSTNKAVGFFATAYKIYSVSSALILAYNTVIIPKMTQSYAKGDEIAMHHYANSAYNFIIDFALPFAAFIFINAYSIIHIVAGSDYDRSITDLQILAPLIFIIGISNIFAMNIVTPMGNDKYLLYTVIVGMLFSLLFNIPSIIYFGDLGASIGLSLTELLNCIVLAYYVKKTWHLTLNFRRLLLCFILLVPFYFINVFIQQYISNFIISVGYNGVLCILYWLFVQAFIFKNRQYFEWVKPYVFKVLNLKSSKQL
jgi:O-antigen/teichoic acid export membrane protein